MAVQRMTREDLQADIAIAVALYHTFPNELNRRELELSRRRLQAFDSVPNAQWLVIDGPSETIEKGETPMKSVIVYGPQGCGKTENGRKIADALGLDFVVDDWCDGTIRLQPLGTLYLTCSPPPARADADKGLIVMSYADAMAHVDAAKINAAPPPAPAQLPANTATAMVDQLAKRIEALSKGLAGLESKLGSVLPLKAPVPSMPAAATPYGQAPRPGLPPLLASIDLLDAKINDAALRIAKLANEVQL